MSYRPSILAFCGFGIWTATVACAEPQTPPVLPAVSVKRVEALIQSEIDPKAPLDSRGSGLVTWWDTSAVVPGLTYVWGRYNAVSHAGNPIAAVAARYGNLRPLRTPEDWRRIAAGWTPRTAEEAVTGCAEFAATSLPNGLTYPVLVQEGTGMDSHPRSTAVFADTARRLADTNTAFRGLSPAILLSDSGARRFQDLRARLEAPRADLLGDASWTAALWGLHDQGAFRYRCTFPKDRWWYRSLARLVVDDSVPWPELGRR